MGKRTKEKDIWLESQLVMATAYTILTAALMAVTIVLGWELWMVPLLAIALVFVWVLHIMQGLTERIRTYNYVILILIEFFFYSTHSTSFFDIPILLILILMLFMLIDELPALYMTLFMYALALIYHCVIIHTINADTTKIEFSRMGLDIVSGLVAFMLTRYLIKRRRQEEENYQAIIEELGNTTRRAEDFLTNVSHEFRTPINAVTGMSDVMLRNEDNAEKRKDLIAIQQAGHRLFTQISDILDYTELDTGRLKISSESYMISSTINDLIADMRFTVNTSDLELVIDVSPRVPSVMIGDEVKVKKIIRHLLDNAYKFTKTGGIYIYIYTLPKDYGVNLCISIQDTGIGVTDTKIDTIYERFYQADAGRSRRAGGMGLGLSIVHGMVREMGGFMHIDSTEGKGTSIHISIPQGVSDETPCMFVEKNDRTCIASYTQPKKYSTPAVREFYDTAIEHLRQGLGVGLHKATSLSELKKLQKSYALSHIYIGKAEYEEDPDFFETLAETLCVIVIAGDDFTPRSDTHVIVTGKPFNGFPITNILANGTKIYMRDVFFAEKRMICPKVKALVVDDDEMNLLVASGILKDYHMEVSTALSGMEALKLCEENTYDIIFLDHMMPEMDGVETMHRLRNLVRYSDENVVIIALTANAVSGAREMFLQEGFDEFVAKPIEQTLFERVLRKVLPASAVQFVAKEAVKKERYASPFAATGKEIPQTEEHSEIQDTGITTLDALNELGVNTNNALQYCRNDQKFFFDLIERFANDARQKYDEIKQLYDEERWETYKIKVHALKSAARTVGLDALSKAAEQLEAAAKKAETDFIKENTHAMLDLYEDTTKKISALFSSYEQASNGENSAESNASENTAGAAKETDSGATESEKREQWLQKLSALKAALSAFESDTSEKIMGELFALSPSEKNIKTTLKKISSCIQDFDFGPATEMADTLLNDAKDSQGGAQ